MSNSSLRRRRQADDGKLGLISWEGVAKKIPVYRYDVHDWYFFYRAPQSLARFMNQPEWKYLNTYKGQSLAQMKAHAAKWIAGATIPEGACAGILAAPAQHGTPPSWSICKKTTARPQPGPMRAYLRGVDGSETLLEPDETGIPEGEATIVLRDDAGGEEVVQIAADGVPSGSVGALQQFRSFARATAPAPDRQHWQIWTLMSDNKWQQSGTPVKASRAEVRAKVKQMAAKRFIMGYGMPGATGPAWRLYHPDSWREVSLPPSNTMRAFLRGVDGSETLLQ